MNHFSEKEIECPCGCGLNNSNPILIEILNTAREYTEIPFKINRCCSCKKHNKEVGGSETSSHLIGLAVDLDAHGSRKRFIIVDALLKAGFNRIGIGKTFIHADIDENKDEEVVWLY